MAKLDRERPITDRGVEDFKFRYAGLEVTYRAGYSEIWDSGARSYESLKLLEAALNHAVKNLSETSTQEVGSQMIRAIVFLSASAVAWKRLLEVAAAYCNALYHEVFDLLIAPTFISAPETTIAAGNVIAAAYKQKLVAEHEAIAIEQAISQIPSLQVIVRYEKPESIRNRLLMCIPQDQIRSEELKELAHKLIEAEDVQRNEPYHRFSTSVRSFSTEDWMREEGVDTKKPENVEVLEAIKPLQAFEQKHMNGTPSAEECASVEHDLKKLDYVLAERNPEGVLSEQAHGVLCAAAELF